MPAGKPLQGWVVRARAGFYEVISNGDSFQCRLRGRFKRGRRELAQPIVVGDQVLFRPVGEGQGIIEQVLERESTLERARGDKPSQVIMANLEQAVLMFTLRDPPLDRLTLDRFLVAVEALDLEICLCINKCDLLPLQYVWQATRVYREVGYPVLLTSVVTGLGLERLKRVLKDRISAITGPSGVGKSTLLNAVQPGLRLRTAPLTALGEGRHTTNEVQLLPLKMGGFVADTPGIRSMELLEVGPENLPFCFPEIAEHGAGCRFQNCSHLREPGCAVQTAVEAGLIDPGRFDSYCQMRLELEVAEAY